MTCDEILRMPKLDLHCHLDGSLTLQSVREALGGQIEAEDLQVSEDCRNLAEYLEKFELPLRCMQTEKGLRNAGREFLLEAAKENIRYIEVRFAPLLSVNDRLNCRNVIESVLEGLEEAKQKCGVHYNVITCVMRHHAQEKSLEMVKISREFLGSGVCAVDLAGDEAAYPMENFSEFFRQVRRWEMPFTIHAGECGRVENIIEAVECGAARIGHGIAMRGHEKVIKMCRGKRIGIEMCPVSNLQTKAVRRKEDYPIQEFMKAGVCVTVNTDNRTVSNTSITKELKFVQENYGVTDEQIRLLMRNAADAAFADVSVKQQLWREL